MQPGPATVSEPPGLRERKKERTRQQFLTAAAELFLERGFDDVTIEQIAARADVSPRTFFRYFRGKDDLVLAELEQRLDQLLTLLRARPAAEPAFDALAAALLGLAAEMTGHREQARRLHALMRQSPGLLAANMLALQAWETTLVGELATRADLPPDDLRARVWTGAALTALRVASDVWLEGDAEGPLGPLLDDALGALRRGVGTLQPTGSSRAARPAPGR